ncbi:MAG: hypothetical protein ACI4RR_04710 [Eubacterium sp.]
MKKFFSLFLSIVMLFGITAGLDITANAACYTCFTDLERISWDRYTGNLGDSRLNILEDEYMYGYGNKNLDGIPTYKNGFEAWIARWNGDPEISWVKATFRLDSLYRNLSGKIGLIKSYNITNFDTTVYFYDDNILLGSYRVTAEDSNKVFNISVENVDYLTIMVKDNVAVCGGTSFALYDMFLDYRAEHSYYPIVDKATMYQNGHSMIRCSVCGDTVKTSTIYSPNNVELSSYSYTYNGKTKNPSVSVVDSVGNILNYGTDYTLTYENGRKNVGTYLVNVNFIGNYSGSKTLRFTIKPKRTSISTINAGKNQFKIKWKKITQQTNGY